MKLAIATLALFFSSTIAAAEYQWDPVVDVGRSSGKVFIDRSSVKTEFDSGKRYVYGNILYVPDNPVKTSFDKKTISVSSFLRALVVACDDNIMSPAVDVYFSVKMPRASDKPLGGIRYPGNQGTAPLEPSSSIYKRFCDPYV